MFDEKDYYEFSHDLSNRIFAKVGQLTLQNQVGYPSWKGPENIQEEIGAIIRQWLSDLEDTMKQRAERASVEEAIKERLSNG